MACSLLKMVACDGLLAVENGPQRARRFAARRRRTSLSSPSQSGSHHPIRMLSLSLSGRASRLGPTGRIGGPESDRRPQRLRGGRGLPRGPPWAGPPLAPPASASAASASASAPRPALPARRKTANTPGGGGGVDSCVRRPGRQRPAGLRATRAADGRARRLPGHRAHAFHRIGAYCRIISEQRGRAHAHAWALSRARALASAGSA